jgi:hypothetical protein
MKDRNYLFKTKSLFHNKNKEDLLEWIVWSHHKKDTHFSYWIEEFGRFLGKSFLDTNYINCIENGLSHSHK